METFNPGYCTIESALLISHSGDEENITGMIGNFSLLQSMGSVALSGEIELLDGVGLINSLPIRGEEGLKIQLRCHDLQTEVKLNLQVIEISDVVQQPGTGDMYAYVLKFITKSLLTQQSQMSLLHLEIRKLPLPPTIFLRNIINQVLKQQENLMLRSQMVI